MNIQELFHENKLNQIIENSSQQLQREPTNIKQRSLLSEMLCLMGDIERADKHLDIICQQEPKYFVGANTIRQLIRAEMTRKECFMQGAFPEFLDKPDTVQQLHLAALIEIRNNNNSKASALLEQAIEHTQELTGECNGVVFNCIRDLDDVFAPFLEVLTTTGKYYWFSFNQIKNINFYLPEHPLDLLWRRAELQLFNDKVCEIYIPATYLYFNDLNLPVQDINAYRLARKTDWYTLDAKNKKITRGIGQKILLVGDDVFPILDIKNLKIQIPH